MMTPRKYITAFVSLILLIAVAAVNMNFTAPKISVRDNAKIYINKELDQCIALLQSCSEKSSRRSLKRIYRKARRHYKHVEFIVEYEYPGESKLFINGPLVLKYDAQLSPNVVFTPHGFQVMEEMLFSGEPFDLEAFRKNADALKRSLDFVRNNYALTGLEEGRLLEMLQLELYRMSALNLNGYDATITLDGVKECMYCIEGLEKTINCFKSYTEDNEERKQYFTTIKKQMKAARKALKKNKDYNTFNRLDFIVKYINPLNASMVSFHNSIGLPWNERQALKLNNPYLFGEAAFNMNNFAIQDLSINTSRQADLGKLLFFDPILSKNNDMSCSSCHDPSKAFTDGRKLSFSRGNDPSVVRNVPSIIDGAFQRAFFHDGRSPRLELQVSDVIHNKNEMESGIEDAVVKLQNSTEYSRMFKMAYGRGTDTLITAYSILRSIAQYERTLLSFNSPFDKYLKGDKTQMTQEAVQGYNLFAGKGLCGSCHFLPTFNGTVPPNFKDSEFEVLGVPKTKDSKEIDADEGRFNVTKKEHQKHAFKTPTVRNIALTAPYMHNGIYDNLEEVVEFYHKGGGKGLGFAVDNQTLPFDSLQLNDSEKKSIVKFLQCLTDTSGITSRPERLPVFDRDPKLNNRKSLSY